MIKRSCDPGFRIAVHQKDLNLTLDGERELGLPLLYSAQNASYASLARRERLHSYFRKGYRIVSKGSKTITGKTVAGSTLSQRMVKRDPKSGQYLHTEALREARTARVKAALTAASAMNTLFRSK